jgi:hypothetical protein
LAFDRGRADQVLHLPIAFILNDVGGVPIVEAVRYREAGEVDGVDEVETTRLSLEDFARHLAAHLGIPA